MRYIKTRAAWIALPLIDNFREDGGKKGDFHLDVTFSFLIRHYRSPLKKERKCLSKKKRNDLAGIF